MIQEVFYGKRENIGQSTIPQEEANQSVIVKVTLDTLNTSTFSVSEIAQAPIDIEKDYPQAIAKKVDILFYNKVNSYGKVLSSIVYLGEPRVSWSKKSISFKPKNLYYNSVVESAMDLQASRDFSYFNFIRYPGKSVPCFIGVITEELTTDKGPANVEYGNTPVMDGWYTLVSAGVLVNPANMQVEVQRGTFVQRNPTLSEHAHNPIEIANTTHIYPSQDNDHDWHPYADYDNKYNIAFYVDPKFRDMEPDWFPPFVRQDFFIMPRYDNVYTKSVKEYVDKQELNNTYTTLKSKYRLIDNYAKSKNFRRAQWYLQSTNLTIITKNWI